MKLLSMIGLVGLVGTAAAAPRTMSVVIDAGHGGSNTGAPGRGAGVYEKQVTLAIARALGRRLAGEGLRVVLTRTRDQYLTLRERARRANAAGADCFLSVHTNASADHGNRGVETYVLGRESADVEARRAAARVSDPAAARLEELARLDAQHGSLRLARAVQARLAAAVGPGLDRGVRQAGYDVLAGLATPAVLVEVGFIDHPIEGPRLLRPEVQERIAAALAEAVFDFFAPQHEARLARR
jgi:N-acetylmuramoyl-L-alanine amidase